MQPVKRAYLASYSRRLERIPQRAIDVALAVAVAAAVTTAINVSDYRDRGSRSPDALAYALGVTIGVLVLVRRRWPVGVLLASVITMQIYQFLNYPGLSAAVPLAVALYTAAATGHLRWALGVSTVYVVGLLVYAIFYSPAPLGSALNEVVRDGSLLVAVLLFGVVVRSHRTWMAEAEERLQRAEEDRKREEQELNAARVIQQQLLPQELPVLAGGRVAAYYQPARAVGDDFYDFVELADGRIALITGDVTDKGIPAALVMATTHSVLRDADPDLRSPGAALARANDRLFADIPANMFVTCLYAVLDPASGRLHYANAGHNLPSTITADGVTELRATGMPLGALPDMTYEENEAALAPGDSILIPSDGLVEAHNAAGEMFGFPRLRRVIETSGGNDHLIDDCLAALRAFVGGNWEREDDITLVTLERSEVPSCAVHDTRTDRTEQAVSAPLGS